jgi:hypothetical protein
VNPPVARGTRILSIDATPTERNTYDPVETAQYFLGVQSVQLMLDWTDIEVAPGVYSDRYLTAIDAYYSARGVSVSLTIRPVDAIHKNVPPDLAGEAFDSPAMIFRFFAVLDYMFAKLPTVTLASVGIGNEVDEWLRLNPETFAAYRTFYNAALYHAKTLRPDVRIGVSANLHALVSGGRADLLEQLNEFSDVLLVLYYPVNFDFTVKPVSVVGPDVDALTARYPSKTIHFREAGYPTDFAPGGSYDAQQAFVTAMFQAWDAHADRIELVSFFRLTDFSPAQVDYYANYYQAQDATFRGFLAGLGLRTWFGDGVYKPAFFQLLIEARARGW